jgi:hypothetical protein
MAALKVNRFGNVTSSPNKLQLYSLLFVALVPNDEGIHMRRHRVNHYLFIELLFLIAATNTLSTARNVGDLVNFGQRRQLGIKFLSDLSWECNTKRERSARRNSLPLGAAYGFWQILNEVARARACCEHRPLSATGGSNCYNADNFGAARWLYLLIGCTSVEHLGT